MLFCTGSPLYFCEFLLIYNIAQYNIAQYFLWQMKPFPLGCSHVSMELITAKSLSAPRYSAIDGAYYGKILIYAPISRYRRGLLRQNPYLRPDIPVSMGLITAKSLSVPRYPAIDGAYYGKIPYLCPDIPVSTGLITAKSLSVPRYSASDGAYYGKILICAPISRYRRGLLRQNSLSVPRYPGIDGAYYGKILICAPISRYRQGLLRQNSYLRPDVQRWRV